MKTSLKEGEEVILITRKHILVLWLPIVVTAFSLVIGIILFSFTAGFIFVLPLLSLMWLGYRIVERNHTIWAVTNLRIIDEEGLFSVETKESPLDKINNVSYSATVMGRMLGYGDVEIQTAAETGSTLYEMVENPRLLKDTITQMQEDYKSLQSRRQAKEMAESLGAHLGKVSSGGIGTELEKLAELRAKGILTEEEFQMAKSKLLNG
jgi:uncharacterized membrane protein YdbT with pleckstrin-like domain